MEKEIKKPCCPNCQSENIVEKGTIKDNGIIGPDYFSWVEDPYYSCRNCGTRFDIV
jgi:transposase-like protein